MADSILRDKSKTFAKEIVFLCRKLKENRTEGVLISQLLKSGSKKHYRAEIISAG